MQSTKYAALSVFQEIKHPAEIWLSSGFFVIYLCITHLSIQRFDDYKINSSDCKLYTLCQISCCFFNHTLIHPHNLCRSAIHEFLYNMPLHYNMPVISRRPENSHHCILIWKSQNVLSLFLSQLFPHFYSRLLSANSLLLFTADSYLIFKEVPLGFLFIGIVHYI